jgi:hypothetical protein
MSGALFDNWTALRSGAMASLGLPPSRKLPLQLVEIRVVGLNADQSVDLGHRVAQIAVTIGRDGAGVAGRLSFEGG